MKNENSNEFLSKYEVMCNCETYNYNSKKLIIQKKFIKMISFLILVATT